LYRSPAWLAAFGLVAHLGSMLVPAIFHLLAMAKVLDFCSVGRYTIASLQGPFMILPESSTLPHFSSLTFCQRLRRTLGIRPKMAPGTLQGIDSCHDIPEKEALVGFYAILLKSYIADFRAVSRRVGPDSRKKGIPFFLGKCHDLVENKW